VQCVYKTVEIVKYYIIWRKKGWINMKEILERLDKIEEALGLNDLDISDEELLASRNPKGYVLLKTIKKLAKGRKEVPIAEIMETERANTKKALESLRRQGDIFEPKKGFIRII
jgi:hypothetical protein